MTIPFFQKLAFLLIGICYLLFGSTTVSLAQQSLPSNYGAKGALSDSSMTFDEGFTYALQDEYLAQARYNAFIKKFGAVRPFPQIQEAEKRHIQALMPLFKQYNVMLPENNATSFIKVPETVDEALEAGITAEIDNIAMYDNLLKLPDLPSNVQNVFSRLRDASKNHLAAFQAVLR